MTSTVRFNVDRLVEIPAEHIAIVEILKGNFDDRIAELKNLIAELKANQEIDQTLEQATAALQEAKNQREHAASMVVQATKDSDAMIAKAQQMMTDANTATLQATSDAAKVASDRSIFEAEKKNAEELMDQRSAALDLRESQLAAMAAKVGEEQRQLAVDKEAFNKRLEALKA